MSLIKKIKEKFSSRKSKTLSEFRKELKERDIKLKKDQNNGKKHSKSKGRSRND
ncbi:hypothetical protein GCM10008932_18210 [Alkalibacterium iburiense]|uniref:Uncharacterized protein n=1 Tax=Alkalibacterium iburiense TaxID=290589 RepID=A0ABN0XKF0_9LACT